MIGGCRTGLYDCVGVGFGPSNISLAIALEERDLLQNAIFIERSNEISWHPGMMIPGTDIQHNPLRDLVTPRNPSSKYGFLNYLKSQGRLFEFLNLSAHYPPRSEYAGYVKWVGNQFLDNVELSTDVTKIRYIEHRGNVVLETTLSNERKLHSKSISFAPGRSYNIPRLFKDADKERVVHLCDYLPSKARWISTNDKLEIVVVGSSQSAAEIALDLLSTDAVAKVTCLSRSFSFKQKDLSAFTEEIYFPEFTDYFHGLPSNAQNEITRELWRSNYGAADPDVIEALNLHLYEQSVNGSTRLEVLGNMDIDTFEGPDECGKLTLKTRQKHTGETRSIHTDAIVLATGFLNFGNGDDQEKTHPLLVELTSNAKFRTDGGVSIERDYRLTTKSEDWGAPLFINGLCEASHGFGDAGSFSLLSVRSDTIAEAIQNHITQNSHANAKRNTKYAIRQNT